MRASCRTRGSRPRRRSCSAIRSLPRVHLLRRARDVFICTRTIFRDEPLADRRLADLRAYPNPKPSQIECLAKLIAEQEPHIALLQECRKGWLEVVCRAVGLSGVFSHDVPPSFPADSGWLCEHCTSRLSNDRDGPLTKRRTWRHTSAPGRRRGFLRTVAYGPQSSRTGSTATDRRRLNLKHEQRPESASRGEKQASSRETNLSRRFVRRSQGRIEPRYVSKARYGGLSTSLDRFALTLEVPRNYQTSRSLHRTTINVRLWRQPTRLDTPSGLRG